MDLKREHYEKIVKMVNEAISNKKSSGEISRKYGYNPDYLRKHVAKCDTLLGDSVTIEELKTLRNLWAEFVNIIKFKQNPQSDKTVNETLAEDLNYDSLSVGECVRSDTEFIEHDGVKFGKVEKYYYNIKIRGEENLTGELSREEMEDIYKLYTRYGSGLTQRTVSRYFPHLTFRDFTRILRAFNITKSSIPIAPHQLEENGIEKNVELVYKNKENDFLKKIEESQHRVYKEKYLSLLEEKINLEKSRDELLNALGTIDLSNIEPFEIKAEIIDEKKSLILYMADIHTGADVSKDSIYFNEYNEEILNERFGLILERVNAEYQRLGRFDRIIVADLGDDLDGLNGETTRGGHTLPQNMNNKVQFNVFINAMCKFIETLHLMDITNAIEYYACTDSNHSGDFGYMANKALELYFNVKYPKMNVRIFEKFIEYFKYGERTFILSHGKDKEHMKTGFPMVITDKVENYINEYLDYHNLSGKITFVSADQHQSLWRKMKRFDYYKVGSIFGSSQWIHTNMGNTKGVMDYQIAYLNGETKQSYIELN